MSKPMPYQSARVLIWGKTYPELSSKYTETVCTGGLREDCTPIRLYPVPLRYLEGPQHYKLYEWITVPIEKSSSDPRPESYKIDPEKIVRREFVDTEHATWATRSQLIFKDPSWHFPTMRELQKAQSETGRSIGMIKPGRIDDVKLVAKPSSEREVYRQKSEDLASKPDLFRAEYKSLEYLPNVIQLLWSCSEPCATCLKRPHTMNVLDWGLLELARRDGWEKAVSRLSFLSDLAVHDFRLFLGTFRLHPKNFGIIGLWYPQLAKISTQGSLF